jgi:IS6 family transposase
VEELLAECGIPVDHSRSFGDVVVAQKRDIAATRRFFTRALGHGLSPTEVITDRAAVYPPVLDELTLAI